MQVGARTRGRIAVIVKGYPRLSETFIAQEILGLEQRGFELVIVSLRQPYDPDTHPIHDEIKAPVLYLPEYLEDDRPRVRRAWAAVRGRPGYAGAWANFRADLARDRTPNRVRRFGQAMVTAAELPADIRLLYVHYLHTPASVARYTARILGLPWTCSAHAKDIWTTPKWEIAEKLADCDWLTTCTRYGADYLRGVARDTGRAGPDKVMLTYHGLDFSRFVANRTQPAVRDGSDPADPVRLLSVGRAVAKKGFDDLLDALARLPASLHWHWTHIGGGALLADLKTQAAARGLDSRITWSGARNQRRVLDAYRSSDLFVLPSKIAADGDRDGLPNVLMEAQSQGLACLASAVSAIPELIVDGETGALAPPDNRAALATALADLIADPGKRRRLGSAGAIRVRAAFDHQDGLDRLAAHLRPYVQDSAAERRAAP